MSEMSEIEQRVKQELLTQLADQDKLKEACRAYVNKLRQEIVKEVASHLIQELIPYEGGNYGVRTILQRWDVDPNQYDQP